MRKYALLLLVPALTFGQNRIGTGLGLLWGEDNLSTRGSAIINRLGKPEDTFVTVQPLFDLSLSLRQDRNRYYLRTSAEGQPPTLQVGLERDGLIFQKTEIFAGFNPFRRVWKDPYLTNIPREKTYSREYEVGVGFTQDRSRLRFRLAFSDVESDELGERESKLRRDRLLTSINYSYSIPVYRGTTVGPSVGLDYSSAKGEANNYAGISLSLNGAYRSRSYVSNFALSVGLDDYMKRDPILQKERDEVSYSGFFSITRNRLFNPNVYLTALVGYRFVNSRADFYDRKTLVLGLLTGYSW